MSGHEPNHTHIQEHVMRAHRFIGLLCVGMFIATLVARPAVAEDHPFVHQLFTDHMVIQRGVPAPVWGWTTPGAEVTVSMAGKSAKATADQDGKWMAKLGPFEAGGPHTLKVIGPQSATISDVLVGDVWICSGQSNMEMGIGNVNNAQQEIASANYPKIRLFTVPKRVSMEPTDTINSAWQVCTPESVAQGGWNGFTAVGYFFGRELHKDLDVPIGLIHTSWGGTIAEAWTSGDALMAMDDFRPAVEGIRQMAEAANRGASEKFEDRVNKWWNDNDPGTKASWQNTDADDASWKTMKLPNGWENAGLPNYDGIAWFRLAVTLPDGAAGKKAKLRLGPIDDIDTTYVNGRWVGGETVWNHPREYNVPAGVLKAGRNVIAVRVLDTGGGGGLFGGADQMTLDVDGASPVSLAGDWRYAATTPISKLPPSPQQTSNNPNVVTVLYNGMLAPIVPYGIKGAIWYQGESNAGRARQYRTLLPTMIADWRKRFGHDFPFFIVQLANFMQVQNTPVQSGWAELREAQLMTAQHDPKTGIAVITDIGDAADIHPKNKQDVGKRLAQSALNIAYGKDVVPCGPEFESTTVSGNEATLRFRYVGSGLMAQGDKITGFAIAGADGQFHYADAKIVGETIVVSSPDVAKPVAVRYGWANNPVCNLYNKEGLPATPFRSDVD
ncbi:MAG: sialate O-acetylesterase [Phycisphaera sp.]|nr:sialate O-acetylesterase [Phycisphaera sp.]